MELLVLKLGFTFNKYYCYIMQPKKTKYNKMHLKSLSGFSLNNTTLTKGMYGLQALERIWLSSKQIEAALKVINRDIKKYGICILRIFPDQTRTVRPSESRMGSGKGTVQFWSAKVLPNTIIFELLGNIPEDIVYNTLKHASKKLPIKTKIVKKEYEKN
jgi:large subunit ribosomal protein L16